MGCCSGASPTGHDCSATVEHLFGMPGGGTRRVPATPIPVLVTLDGLWPRETITIRGVTLGVRAFGLRVDGVAPGLLVAWERSSGGSWLGVCVLQLHSPNGRVHRDLLQLVPAKAIRRREDDAGIATVVPSPTEARRESG